MQKNWEINANQATIIITLFMFTTMALIGQTETPTGGVTMVQNETEEVRNPNILIISLDALRYDRLGHTGYFRDTTPAIDALAREGFIFHNMYSVSSWTLPSMGSLFTGFYPHHSGYYGKTDGNIMPDEYKLIGEYFQENGYRTLLGYESAYPLEELQFGQGMDYVYKSARKKQKDIRNFVADSSKPFFALVHYLPPHSPYKNFKKGQYFSQGVPDGYQFWTHDKCKEVGYDLTLKELDYRNRLYDSNVRSADLFVQDLIKYVDWENTIVIITSDHGEELHEHGQCDHGKQLYQESIHIPFIVAGMGLTGESHEVVSQVDILPTLLNLAGINQPTILDGKSLTPCMKEDKCNNRTIYAGWTTNEDTMVRDGDYKLIHDKYYDKYMLFDLGRDDVEKQDLCCNHPEYDYLKQKLTEWKKIKPIEIAETYEYSDLQLDVLKGLGYCM